MDYLTMLRYGLATNMFTAGMTRAPSNDEGLGIIELDENLSDAEKPLELPAGLYTAEIQDVQIGTSQKGNRYFAIKFVVPTDQIAPDVADQFEDGAALFYNRIVVPGAGDRRAKFNLRKFVEALGLDTNTTQIDPNDWMGCTARIKVVTERYQGKERAQIKSVESAEAPKASGTSNRAAAGVAKETAAPAARGRSRK